MTREGCSHRHHGNSAQGGQPGPRDAASDLLPWHGCGRDHIAGGKSPDLGSRRDPMIDLADGTQITFITLGVHVDA